ncbi:MAG TPA: STAS domain-containing protein [Jiangellaceae bacterium]|nr:STAS domain-containing protein [Jiangellaceae bacterium]
MRGRPSAHPTLVVHGTENILIPPGNGERLAAASHRDQQETSVRRIPLTPASSIGPGPVRWTWTQPHTGRRVHPHTRPRGIGKSELTFTDASGIGVLVQVRMLVHGYGGRLTLHGIRPFLRRLLVITGLTSAFELESSLATLNDRSALPGSAALHGV